LGRGSNGEKQTSPPKLSQKRTKVAPGKQYGIEGMYNRVISLGLKRGKNSTRSGRMGRGTAKYRKQRRYKKKKSSVQQGDILRTKVTWFRGGNKAERPMVIDSKNEQKGPHSVRFGAEVNKKKQTNPPNPKQRHPPLVKRKGEVWEEGSGGGRNIGVSKRVKKIRSSSGGVWGGTEGSSTEKGLGEGRIVECGSGGRGL